MKRSLICLAVPMMLFAGGCGNEESKKEDKIAVASKEEKVAYIDQVIGFSNDFETIMKKMSKLTSDDMTLFSNKEEFIGVINEFTDLFDRLNNMEPDEKYKTQHEKLKRAMGYYAESFQIQLDNIDNPSSSELALSTSKLKDGLAIYKKSMGAINDIRRGNEIGTTEKSLEEKKQQNTTSETTEGE
ncbi:hypothetical protein P4493_05530 [Bacillus thuringiensis]|jgi:hypothetical protein|uniref:DUF7018 domain-containing protein n=3 Tax=Bacillus thuringiensis TaxID=1428 RepID=A0A0B5NJ76_BACTU|nr:MULTISPECIES: hypothetical protein [Bacillus]EAO56475.1 hypothetical protein RBTH_07447 [Bacillus thuringiensis serovar israelensis ATCC 35646]MEC2534081.1 hypothetical protein [Bacillus cereus]MED1153542.1 hypothetical protein [Bacillus paranthracis]OUB09165.1 hypothetical protein BK708_32015 [Bacillus thuringiensis serovar yunnanensis]AFQ29870.1 hypothetical protein BTF1_28847 [Bacillus thuringiensis HD-789]